ncbi:transcriptional regulator [Kingella negevensis]|uniref:transcriptional regulator n=1 Tax=Kingella negevensis TaxID=1522312 RepID=UPI00050A12A1|nr:YdaS family helix-turn-helix protein [Kingella negevensis]MDK4688531.1 YdaS family helix-turn-helix protein [Kingella negevensis]
MDLKTYCSKNYGAQARIAMCCGISAGFVNHWVSGHRPVPIHHCLTIELAANGEVTRKDLCPDWREIWTDIE